MTSPRAISPGYQHVCTHMEMHVLPDTPTCYQPSTASGHEQVYYGPW